MKEKPNVLLHTDGYDPIVAIATAPGKGGVGVVRLSFPSASAVTQVLSSLTPATIKPRYATRLYLKDAAGDLIDDGLLLYCPSPFSFTGEHVIEFQGHGGVAVLRAIVSRFLEIGASSRLRLARPGEFTERAFLNDKLDLAQAEAVADLIDASSITAAKAAAKSLVGDFSRLVNSLADETIHLRLLVEATLDFPEEEIEFLEKAGAKQQLASIQHTLFNLLKAAKQGAQLRDGLTLVLAGRPNVGKSSLLNALAGQDLAIVTSVPGTTRDRISQSLEINGISVTVVDTAGLRLTHDEIEQIGIERTQESLRDADVVLHVLDSSSLTKGMAFPELLKHESDVTTHFPSNVPVIHIFNKCDVYPMELDQQPDSVIEVSAKTGQGMDALRTKILEWVGVQPGQDFAFLARDRHIQALVQAQIHMDTAADHAKYNDRVLDLFAEELRLAHDALGEITGRMLPDDLLGLIFSRFCIGK